jgi:hypothetical protein
LWVECKSGRRQRQCGCCQRWRGCSRARPDDIFVAPFEAGEIGPDLFRKACDFGLEGLVSKRADRPYRAGRSPDWVKVKNRKHPAVDRVAEAKRARAFARAE